MPRSRQIVVIMFTDLVGYTALMGKDEPQALQILAQNKNLHQRLLNRYGGKFLKEMGDGILATFQNVTDAIYCAGTLIQETSGSKDLNLRIGIHLGEVVMDGNELYGDGVNIASRIERIAQGGQILVSETIYKNVKNRPEIMTSFTGEHTLKNVDEPIKVYSVKVDVIPEEYNGQTPTTKKRITLKNPVLVTGGILAIAALGYFAVLKLNTTSTSEVQLEKSIAVLPFADMSPEQDQAYLGDGIAEEILNMLGRLEGMKVIAPDCAKTIGYARIKHCSVL